MGKRQRSGNKEIEMHNRIIDGVIAAKKGSDLKKLLGLCMDFNWRDETRSSFILGLLQGALMQFNKEVSVEELKTIFKDSTKIRKQILDLCIKQAAWDSYHKPTEKTEFGRVCNDLLDFVELVMNCEKALQMTLDDREFTEDSFETVEDFIDWVIKQI